MIKRQPEAAKWARGMPGGLDNPLGARTLHLYQNGAYTLYTIYASLDPESIGEMVQDCEVCCEPWQMTVRRGPGGKLAVSLGRT